MCRCNPEMAYNPITNQPVGNRILESFDVKHDLTSKRPRRQFYMTPQGMINADKKPFLSGNGMFEQTARRKIKKRIRGPLHFIPESHEADESDSG